MTEFLMKPKIDFAFKEIMMNEKARIGFLSAILKIDPSDIKETQILNTYLRKEHEEDKQGILDVRILDFILFEEPTNVSDDSKPATQSNFTHAFIFGMITGTFFLQIVKNVWNMKQEKKLFEIINK